MISRVFFILRFLQQCESQLVDRLKMTQSRVSIQRTHTVHNADRVNLGAKGRRCIMCDLTIFPRLISQLVHAIHPYIYRVYVSLIYRSESSML
ncbi:hypothetical protein DFH28DRAFT_243648 [Melampsora americana]|nr:hypothetical protein DFH28DRAFT_279692 [Melampsora americana]KAH9824365.1 hypothetical protein DFH28DRAFT_243648 [Melampsora americana]